MKTMKMACVYDSRNTFVGAVHIKREIDQFLANGWVVDSCVSGNPYTFLFLSIKQPLRRRRRRRRMATTRRIEAGPAGARRG